MWERYRSEDSVQVGAIGLALEPSSLQCRDTSLITTLPPPPLGTCITCRPIITPVKQVREMARRLDEDRHLLDAMDFDRLLSQAGALLQARF